MNMLEKKYDHRSVESKWQQYWNEHEVYKWDAAKDRAQTFVIDTPPPTVSGLLHMGHIYSYAQADFIARFQRMRGKTVFYPIGFDDNGLPTERLVEKDQGIRAVQIERSEFVAICRKVVAGYEKEFKELFKSIAFSFDWNQEYQTISDRTKTLSQMSFIDLYNKELLYRKNAPTFWDTMDQTAIAQAEIDDREQVGIMSEIKFHTDAGDDIAIATTRPEMLPACVAIFYHPNDTRYQVLQGKKAVVPIFNQVVPILSDVAVDIEKGTGLVMCCTFGDMQDVKWWQDHKLELRECITKLGEMKNSAFMDGLKVKAAREVIIHKLDELGLIFSKKTVNQAVKSAERSGTILEILPTYQWYIAVMQQKDLLLEQAAKCVWHPEYMKIRLDNWIKGLNQDWCISRQRYSGVPFPVWYSRRKGEEGKILLADLSQLPVDPRVDLPKGYSSDEVTPELDIMDTWATSSLTPQLSSYGISVEMAIDHKRHSQLFPADLRPQAHEIIRTWTFTTIVKSLYHQNSIPWNNVMISGWCLAHDKSKMSKSKGNVVTPQKLIEEKSADVIRYWASNSKLGADIVYSDEAFKIGQKLINKIRNVVKFCSIHLPKMQEPCFSIKDDVSHHKIYEPTDLWILSKLTQVIAKAQDYLESFEYCSARALVEDFFWKDYCDNYIELAKSRIYDDANTKAQQSGIRTIYYSLKIILKLFAPFLPYITEELYQSSFAGDVVSIHAIGSWPDVNDGLVEQEAINQVSIIVGILELVRKNKSMRNVSIAQPIALLEIALDQDNLGLSQELNLCDLSMAVHAKEIKMISISNLPADALRSECGGYGIIVS